MIFYLVLTDTKLPTIFPKRKSFKYIFSKDVYKCILSYLQRSPALAEPALAMALGLIAYENLYILWKIPLLYFIILKGLHSHTGEDIIPESRELFRCRSCGLRDFSSPEERSPLSEDAHLHKVKQGCDSMESTRIHYILHKQHHFSNFKFSITQNLPTHHTNHYQLSP